MSAAGGGLGKGKRIFSLSRSSLPSSIAIRLLIVDPFPPGPRDPNGVHAAIWEQVQEDVFQPPANQQLTLVAYECDLTTRAYS